MTYPSLVAKQLGKDAPYSWFLLDQAKHNPRYNYADYKLQATRVESYLDALVVAYHAGEDIASWLSEGDWGVCFVLASLGVGLQDHQLFQTALNQLDENQETHYREIVDACVWYQCDNLSPWVLKLLLHPSPVAKQSALALARHESFHVEQEQIHSLLHDPHPAIQSQLLHWLGEGGHEEHTHFIQQHYAHKNNHVAFAAARAGFLFKDPDAFQHIQQMALTTNPSMRDAIALLFVSQQDTARLQTWLTQLWDSDQVSQRAKIYAIAIAGLSTWVEPLLELMEDEHLARAAGEAFTLITGIDIEEAGLDDEEFCGDCALANAEQEEAHAAERKKDTLFASPWEEDLPMPDAEKMYVWWESQKGKSTDGDRYLAGHALSEESLKFVLNNGNQGQRHIAAQHLSLNFAYPWININA